MHCTTRLKVVRMRLVGLPTNVGGASGWWNPRDQSSSSERIEMSSHILAKLHLDEQRLKVDPDTLRSFPRIEEAYDEFSSGYWKNCSLWNSSGDVNDTTYRGRKGELHETTYGKELPYLERLAKETFDMDHVTMVRARNLI